MSKAEKFIQDCTRNCSQLHYNSACTLRHCITPDQARKAVEIAREEITERALIAFQVVCNRPAKLLPNCESYCNACKQFKQAIKDE